MSAKDLKALTRHLFEEWSKGKVAAMAAMDATIATNIVFHGGSGMEIRGIKDLKQYISAICDAFPDVHYTIDDIVAEGDKVVIRDTWTGTNKGAFMGIPPTNKKMTMWEIQMAKVVGGKFVETWSRYDTLGLMQQFGIIPTPGKGK
jgi:predicted ester cyclase